MLAAFWYSRDALRNTFDDLRHLPLAPPAPPAAPPVADGTVLPTLARREALSSIFAAAFLAPTTECTCAATSLVDAAIAEACRVCFLT